LQNWSVYSLENNINYCHQISSFKAKMHQIRFLLGLRPRPRCGSSQRSPRPPSSISGVLLLKKRRGIEENRAREKEKKQEGQKGKEKKRRRGPQYTFLATPLRKKEGEGQQKGREQKGRKKLMGEREESVRVGGRLPPGAEGGWTPLENCFYWSQFQNLKSTKMLWRPELAAWRKLPVPPSCLTVPSPTLYATYRVFTRSSKRPANIQQLACVFWIHLLEVCWIGKTPY